MNIDIDCPPLYRASFVPTPFLTSLSNHTITVRAAYFEYGFFEDVSSVSSPSLSQHPVLVSYALYIAFMSFILSHGLLLHLH